MYICIVYIVYINYNISSKYEYVLYISIYIHISIDNTYIYIIYTFGVQEQNGVYQKSPKTQAICWFCLGFRTQHDVLQGANCMNKNKVDQA